MKIQEPSSSIRETERKESPEWQCTSVPPLEGTREWQNPTTTKEVGANTPTKGSGTRPNETYVFWVHLVVLIGHGVCFWYSDRVCVPGSWAKRTARSRNKCWSSRGYSRGYISRASLAHLGRWYQIRYHYIIYLLPIAPCAALCAP